MTDSFTDHRGSLARERSEVAVLSSAFRTMLKLNRMGFWVRLACVAIMFVVTITTSTEQWRAFFLIFTAVGAILSGIEHPTIWRQLIPEGSWLRRYIEVGDDVPRASIAGVTEAVGLFFSGLLFLGPWPLDLAPALRAVGLVALCILVASVSSQILIDAKWYSREHLPRPYMRAFRWVFPPLVAAIIGLLLWWPSPHSLPPLVALLAGSTFLLFWPWVVYADILIEAIEEVSQEQIAVAFRSVDDEASSRFHQTKNYLKGLEQKLDDCDDSERRIIENLLSHFALEWSAGLGAQYVAAEQIWQACLTSKSVDAGYRDGTIEFWDETNGQDIESAKSGLFRAATLDLVHNALAAGATSVRVILGVQKTAATRDLVCLIVEDNGPGYLPDSYTPGTSLHVLHRQFSISRGSFSHVDCPTLGGARVEASLRAFTQTTSIAGGTR